MEVLELLAIIIKITFVFVGMGMLLVVGLLWYLYKFYKPRGGGVPSSDSSVRMLRVRTAGAALDRELEKPRVAVKDILPPELWDKVLDNLEEPNDFHAAVNTCSVWNGLLHNKKSSQLFGDVLPDLLKKDRRFPLSAMLVLRQVDRSWKRAVDSELAKDPERFGLVEKYTFRNASNLERFLGHVDSLPLGSNPFLGRCANFWLHLQPVPQLLHTFGRELKTVALTPVGLTPHEFCAILEQLPNVESLRIGRYITLDQSLDAPHPLQLPQLPNLTSLEFISDFPIPVYTQEGRQRLQDLVESLLTVYGGNLTSFATHFFVLENVHITPLVPNLKHLKIEQGDFRQENIQVLVRPGWRLKHLDIQATAFLPTTDFIDGLNYFAPTLECLKVCIYFENGIDVDALDVFPKLKELHVEVASVKMPWTKIVMTLLQLAISGIAPNLKRFKVNYWTSALDDITRMVTRTWTWPFFTLFNKLFGRFGTLIRRQ